MKTFSAAENLMKGGKGAPDFRLVEYEIFMLTSPEHLGVIAKSLKGTEATWVVFMITTFLKVLS